MTTHDIKLVAYLSYSGQPWESVSCRERRAEFSYPLDLKSWAELFGNADTWVYLPAYLRCEKAAKRAARDATVT